MSLQSELWLYLVTANLFAFIAFGYDKARARAGKSRVPERDLLLLALVGGAPGGCMGRWAFRHKTRKVGFSVVLLAIATLQLGLLGWLVIRP